jgi:hypothetical protein
MSDRLEQFVRDALAGGADRETVRTTLRDAGWPAAEIDAALAAWVDTPFGVPAPRRRVQTSDLPSWSTSRDQASGSSTGCSKPPPAVHSWTM